MEIPTRNLLSAALCLRIRSAFAAEEEPSRDQLALVIAHVTVIDATGAAARQDTTVVVLGDRIATIGNSKQMPIPKAARVVD